MKRVEKTVVIHHCGQCGKAVFDCTFANLNVKGEPTLVSCPQSGRFKKVVSEIACDEFVLRIND